MRVTIKDIAKATGVSHSTVSRALRGQPEIPKETADKIKRVAIELGYVPSAVARGLKTQRSNALGVVVSRIDDPFFSEVLQGIEDVLRSAGFSLFVAASNRDSGHERTIVQAMRQRQVDGVILSTTQFGEEHRSQLEDYGVPIVAIGNRDVPYFQWLVYHDDAYGVGEIAKYLIQMGHKKIAFLGNKRAERTSQARLKGLRSALKAAQLPLAKEYVFHCPDGQPYGGEVGARHFLNLEEPPTALICFNDMMALGVMKILRENGIRVPEDCSVTGFDDIDFAAYTSPALTTFEQPKYRLGYEAAQMMRTLLQSNPEDNAEQGRAVRLRGRLVVRETTAPPPVAQ